MSWMIHSGTDSPQAEVLLVLKISINLDQSKSSDKQPSIFLSARQRSFCMHKPGCPNQV